MLATHSSVVAFVQILFYNRPDDRRDVAFSIKTFNNKLNVLEGPLEIKNSMFAT